jgi:hypothetical protein
MSSQNDSEQLGNPFYTGKGTIIMAAAGRTQIAWEGQIDGRKHSLFTSYLIKGLRNGVEAKKEYITVLIYFLQTFITFLIRWLKRWLPILLRLLQNSYDEGRHTGMPLQNLTSFRIVGANLRVRPLSVGVNLRVRPLSGL